MSLSASLLSLLCEHSPDENVYQVLVEAVEQETQALAESERAFRTLAENSPNVVARYDQDLRHVYVNNRIQDITGKPAEFFMGKSDRDIYPNLETFTDWEQALLSIFIHKRGRSLELSSEVTGKLRYYECQLIPEFNQQGNVETVLSVVYDVTRRKLAEKTLRAEQRLNRLISNNLTDMVAWTDVEGRILHITPSCQPMLGYAPEELLYTSLYPLVHPDDLAIIDELRLKFPKSSSVTGSFRLRRSEGAYIWVESTMQGVFNEETGQREGLISVTRDITERLEMEAELREQQRQNVALQKEAELSHLKDQMMVRISHEFRTPLAVIVTSVDVLQNYGDKLSEEKRLSKLQRITQQTTRLTNMLEDITLLIRKDHHKLTPQFSSFDLHALAEEVIADAKLKARTSHNITFTSDVQQICGDPRLITAILANLLSNAVKYSPTDTSILITVTTEGENLVLQVQDAGIGIPEPDLPRIFAPFFRGSNFDERPGLGLGLSMVKNMVDVYQGVVEVTSQAGQGTSVVVRLPQKLA